MPLWLVQAIIIMGVTRFLSSLGAWFRQPRVIFEIIGGIALGPSALGRNKHFLERCFPEDSLIQLQVVAEMGLILYLFLVGLELDPQMLLNNWRKAGSIALVGMAVPFALGVAISPILFHVLMSHDKGAADVDHTAFFVFIGTSLSITAFPVLARILKEGGLIYSKAGATAMGAAAIGDAFAWCLLILAIAIANATTMTVALWVFLTTVAAAFGLFVLVRPVFEKIVIYVESKGSPAMEQNLFAFTIIFVFFCAWCTAIIGVHAIFGAFMFGLIVPRNTRLFSSCEHHIEQFVLTICLPIYFALSGLKTDVTQIKSNDDGAMVVLVCFVATVGKFLGAGIPSYFNGMSIRQSSTVAVLMNTRGLIELIILNLGVESGILNTKVFTVMVLMAVFTTFLTCPLIELIFPLHRREKEREKERQLKLQNLVPGDDQGEVGSVLGSLVPEMSSINLQDTFFKPCVVISYLDQLPDILHLIYAFLPSYNGDTDVALDISEFQLFVLRCIPPTHTSQDRFLGFDASGEVLQITSDNQTIDTYVNTLQHLDTKQPPPDLFPLTMLCQTIGIDVDIKRMTGDPNAFPQAIQKSSTQTSSDLLILPWKSTEFLSHLLASTVAESFIPVAVLVPPETSVESDSMAPKGHRSPSIGGLEMTEVSQIVTPAITSNGTSSSPRGRLIQSVGVVLCGNPSDSSLLLLTKRFLSNSTLSVTLFIPLNSSTWENSMKTSIEFFTENSQKLPNLTIVHLPILQVEFDKLSDHLSVYKFQFLLCSFVEEATNIRSMDENEMMSTSSPRGRSESIGEILTDAVGRLINSSQKTNQDKLIELGSLGSHLHFLFPSSYLLVIYSGKGGLSSPTSLPTSPGDYPNPIPHSSLKELSPV
jgi:Kef-type K+ transport system membrane component KefB